MAKYRRKRVNKRYSKRLFTRTARKVNRRNLPRHVSRGGIRL